MKKYCMFPLFIGLMFIGHNCFSQVNNTESRDSTNVYFHSFKLFCNYVEKYFPNTKEILLEENAITTNSIPAQIGGLKITLISNDNLKKEFKRRNEKMYITRIIPLRLKEESFFVNIIPFKVDYKSKHFFFANGGAFVAHYRYDCGEKKFILKKKDGGFDNIN